jgi:AcrR family transcriptional regulator
VLRRSTEEIRGLILEAATELFAEQSYAATTTSQIAKRAEVGERLLFANFGTKAELFEATVITPFARWIADYFAAWERNPGGDSQQDQIQGFVDGFFRLARRHRRILLSLAAAGDNQADPLRSPADLIRGQLGDAMQRLHVITRAAITEQGVPGLDIAVTVTVTASAVLGAALLDDWVTPHDQTPPDDERLVEELTAMLCYGLLRRPPTTPTVGTPSAVTV